MINDRISSASLNQTVFFQPILDSIHRVTSLPISFWVPDEERKALRIAASVGLPENYVRTASIDMEQPSVIGDAFRKKKIQKVLEIEADPRWKYKEQAREMNWKSAIFVPIEVDGIVIGVIGVYAFTERSIPELVYILPDFANQISLTLEAAKHQEVLRQIIEIGEKLQSMAESPKDVLNAIVKGACELTGASSAVIYPYDAEHGEFFDIENVAYFGLKGSLNLTTKPRAKGGMAAYVKRRGEVIITNIEKQDPKLFATSSLIQREEIRAFMGIALKVAHHVLVGVLYVNYRTPHTFTREEKDTIRLFAHQASNAVNNARLYQQASSRIDALEKLHEVGRALTSIPSAPKSLRKTLIRIAQSAKRVLGADLVDFYEYVQSRDWYDLPPIQLGERYHLSVAKTEIYEDDVVWGIVKDRQPKYITHAQDNKFLTETFTVKRPDAPPKRFVEREDIKSTAAVPLMAGAEVVGVLFANYRSNQTFSQQQRKLIELFAAQAAIAISNTRLFISLQKRLEERLTDINAFQEIYEKMYSADQRELMSLIAGKAVQLTGADYGGLWLIDETATRLENAATADNQYFVNDLPKLVLDDKSINSFVVRAKKPYLSKDVQKDAYYRDWYPGIRSELAVPLFDGDKVIGTLDVESRIVGNFTTDHQLLLEALASQATVVIQNKRLLRRLDALGDIGRALTSTLRLRESEILDLIYDEVSLLMDTNNMYIALYDERTDRVRFGLAFVEGKKVALPPRRAGKGRIEEIIHTRKQILHQTVEEARVWHAKLWPENYLKESMTTSSLKHVSYVGVPMIVDDKVVGVLATYHPTQEYVYSKDDLEILQAMANQAAIAIDNAHMFYGVNQRLNALVDFGQAVTSEVRLGENRILEIICAQISQMMNANNIYIALYDERTDTVRSGLAVVDGKKINWVSQKVKNGKTDEIIKTKTPIFHATRAESEAWYSQPEHKEYVKDTSSSWLGVPMIVGEKVLGVIGTYDDIKEYLYSADDLEDLKALAYQAAIALDSARSFQNAQYRINDLEAIDRIIKIINTKVSTRDLVQTIAAKIQENLKCKHCTIFFPEKIGDETFLISKYAHGDYAEDIQRRRFKLGDGLTGWVFEHGEAAIVPDVSLDTRFAPARAREYEPRSLLVVPVRKDNQSLGVICADDDTLDKFDEDELRFVETVAGHVSIALEKAQLIEEARIEAADAKLLAEFGTTTAALQHRINNTLNIIVPNITRLRSRVDVTDPTIKEILDIIERNTRFTSKIMAQILAPLQQSDFSDVDVNSVLKEAFDNVRKERKVDSTKALVKAEISFDKSVPIIRAPVAQLSEVFRNLIENAYRAMENGGKLTVTSRFIDNTIFIRIKDTAEGGIPLSVQERLFQKPFLSKQPGAGTGLGLWLGRLMLQVIGGNVTIEKTGANGTTMLVEIPVL